MAQSVWNAVVSLDVDLVFSTNIHMILDTQVELQTLYFSLSTIFANVRWKLVEFSCPVVLDTYRRHLYLTIVSGVLRSPRLWRQTIHQSQSQCCYVVVELELSWSWTREEIV